MIGINNYDSSSISRLFSGLNSRSGSTTDLFSNINVADYNSIRSGSYYGLLKSYYGQGLDSTVASNISSKISTSKEDTETLARVEDKAESLKKSADTLLENGRDSLFKKVSVTDEEGKTSSQYDVDKIYKGVSDFVKSYNSLMDEEDSQVSNISRSMSRMQGMSKANAGLLRDVGITIDEKQKLVLDEETFRDADMNVVKSLFQSTGSYGYQVSAQASMVDYYAQNEAAKSNTYGNTGMYTYNYNTGDIYNGYI